MTGAAWQAGAVAAVSPRRLLSVVRGVLVIAVSALVLAVAGFAFVASFEAISVFAVQVGAFPPGLWWVPPLLVDSFTMAATLLLLWIGLSGQRLVTAWDVWYAWGLVALASAASVAINVAHAPDTQAARLVAALPPMALLCSVELLMIVARRVIAQLSAVTPAPIQAAELQRTAAVELAEHDRVPAAGRAEAGPEPGRLGPPAAGGRGRKAPGGSAADIRRRARRVYEELVAAGRRPTGAVLGRAVGVTDRYGRTLLAEFRLQDSAAGNGRPGGADGQPR